MDKKETNKKSEKKVCKATSYVESGEWGGGDDENFDDEGVEETLNEFFGADGEETFDGESSTSAAEYEYTDDLIMRARFGSRSQTELYDEQTEEGLSELGMHYCDEDEE